MCYELSVNKHEKAESRSERREIPDRTAKSEDSYMRDIDGGPSKNQLDTWQEVNQNGS